MQRHHWIIAGLALVGAAAATPAAHAQAGAASHAAGAIAFKHDSDAIDVAAATQLDKVIALYAASKLRAVEIAGHADPGEGEPAYCMGLAQRRAGEVRTYLWKHGVPDNVMTTLTYGSTQPVKAGENRRVEITFTGTANR